MIIERLKGFWRDDLELEHRQVIIRNAIEQIEDLREALALEQRTAGAEIEKLREAVASERERCVKIAEQARDDTCDGPVAWSMADSIAAAIRESGNE